ncbi:lysylphosphatidylglycerol synthase transmembrane domain-containing protein [Ilumatobacter fluminis]|uniref:lysylphosphatidylglycerol synthase transmembrane domain-containing protein n=1 Tax=Ilumatobacter fluminis TaxID=467091 RepID=UPI0032EB00D0
MNVNSEPAGLDVGAMFDRPPAEVSQIFASDRDETRVRRPADAVMVVVSAIVVALAGWASGGDSELETWIADIFDDAPAWMRSIAVVGFSLCGIAVLALVAVVAFRSRWALVRDVFTAIIVTLLTVVVLGQWVSSEWPDLVPEIWADATPPFPIVRVAMVVAVLLTVRPSLTAPLRRLDRWVIGTSVVGALMLGYGTLTTVIGGLGVGIGAAALVRFVFGTSIGLPTLDRVTAALHDLNVAAVDLAYLPEQPNGWLEVTGRDREGPIAVRIYGRDAADSAFANRLWRAMWYRDAAWSLGVSRQELAEHEALLLLLAHRSGIAVPDVVAVGSTSTGDVMLVTRRDEGRSLDDLTDDELDDALVGRVWEAIEALHRHGMVHGHLDPSRITVGPDGTIGFLDLARGSMTPSPLKRRLDLVETLTTTALLVGPERAIAAAAASPMRHDLEESVSTLQSAALSRELSGEVRRADLDVDDLRTGLVEALGVETPELAKLRRVRWVDILMIALAFVAANALISWIASIDLDTFIDELQSASLGWLLLAFIISQSTNIAETISMMGVVSHPLPFGPTMQFQYAVSYIGLAVPSDAGRIAMTIRYLQKLGVPTRVAVGQGPFTTVFGWLIDLVLLLVSARVVGADIDLPDDTDFTGFITIVIILAVAAVIAVVVVLAVPKFRNRVLPPIIETVHELKGAVSEPDRAAKLLGGLVAKKLLFAMTLAAILYAYGEPLSFATVVFVNTAVSWFAGVFPVPGGIGVAEASFVVGLTAFGVPDTVALAVALTHRLFTTYLPPIAGFFTMKRLEQRGYL